MANRIISNPETLALCGLLADCFFLLELFNHPVYERKSQWQSYQASTQKKEGN